MPTTRLSFYSVLYSDRSRGLIYHPDAKVRTHERAGALFNTLLVISLTKSSLLDCIVLEKMVLGDYLATEVSQRSHLTLTFISTRRSGPIAFDDPFILR